MGEITKNRTVRISRRVFGTFRRNRKPIRLDRIFAFVFEGGGGGPAGGGRAVRAVGARCVLPESFAVINRRSIVFHVFIAETISFLTTIRVYYHNTAAVSPWNDKNTTKSVS